MSSVVPVTCLICGDARPIKVFSAPHDKWSRAIGWKHGATYFHCRSCTGLTQWPRMTEDEYVRFYEVAQRSEATGFSDDGVPEFHLEHKRVTAALKWEFFEELGLGEHVPAGSRVFEIGAAEGTLLTFFRDHGYEVAGVEPLARYAEHARSHFGLDVETGYFGIHSQPAATPDLVVLDNVLEHLPEPTETLRGIKNLLGDRGAVLVLVPNVETPVVSNANVAHNTLWSRRSLEAALRDAGFSVMGIVPGRPARQPHEWVALALAGHHPAPALADGPTVWEVRRAWFGALHLPAVKARARKWLGPVYRPAAAAARRLPIGR